MEEQVDITTSKLFQTCSTRTYKEKNDPDCEIRRIKQIYFLAANTVQDLI